MFIVVYFINSVRKLLDTSSYIYFLCHKALQQCEMHALKCNVLLHSKVPTVNVTSSNLLF